MAQLETDRQFWQETQDRLRRTKDAQLSAVIQGLEQQRLDKSGLLAWSNDSLQYARLGVELAAEAMDLKSLSVEAWTGIQGAGKGTNLKAIREASIEFSSGGHPSLPKSLDKLVKRYSGQMGEITTGTGGMFYKPAPNSEYANFFAPIGNISLPYTSTGELVPDVFVSTMVAEMIRRRILEGKDSVQIDLYPRDKTQFVHTQRLLRKLERNGVSTSLTVVDLRLLPKEALDHLEANKDEYSNAATDIGAELIKFHDQEKEKQLPPEQQFENINQFLDKQEAEAEEKSARWWLIQENKAAVHRMQGRSRADDQPLPIVKRTGSYYAMTMPGLINVKGTKFVSADQEPEEVVSDLVKTLVDPSDANSPEVDEFISIAQKKADAIVNG